MRVSQEQPLRLCDFLHERQEGILAHWERAVRASAEVQRLSTPQLRDHIPAILERISDIVRTVHEPQPVGLDDLPDLHALDRLATGFDLRAAAHELSLLRDVALMLWRPHAFSRDPLVVVDEIRRFNAAVDEVVARSVERYARARERTLTALDRVSSAALGTGELEKFLPRLLAVILETTAAADSVYVMLRDEENPSTYRMRAAAGVGAERSLGFAVRVGEGFAGSVAQRREPLLTHDASVDPIVLNPALRSGRVHAVYGVPLIQDDDVVGVAILASHSAYDFSEDDRQLLRIMAQRATSIIVQAQLVTRTQQAFDAFRRSDEELRRVMETSPDMLAMVGADGYLKRVNSAFGVVLGYSEAELLAMPYTELIHPEDRERVAAEVRTVLEGRPAHRFTFRSIRKDGTVRWTAYNATAIPNTDVLVAAGRDVTGERERSQFEQQLIGIVGHDLRSPLSAILMSATALLRHSESFDERTVKGLARIHSAAQRASLLIRDLLDFTKARTVGGITITQQAMDLHVHARRVSEEVNASYPERSVEFDQQGNAEGFWDPARIEQVLENLVSNAFKYGRSDRPVVVRTIGGERWVRLEVHNQGEPIDPDLLPHIFEPLRQGARGAATPFQGVGLGLYIVDHLVRAHGGTIEVHSTAAEGTAFLVQLPRKPPAHTAGA